MPVPVPKKQPAHPVLKSSNNLRQNGQSNRAQNLITPLPASPVGLPPSFGTREQWINSLPSWRRSKPRATWEDVAWPSKETCGKGLNPQDKAQYLKASRVQAHSAPYIEPGGAGDTAVEADDEMSPSSVAGAAKWSGDDQMDVDHHSAVLLTLDLLDYERGAFTPVFEDQSPVEQSHIDDSSPLQLGTPFGEFVDRAVSAALTVLPAAEEDANRLPAHDSPSKPFKDTAPPQEVVTPTATSGYKKLAEPLSEWVANFVWRACTTTNSNISHTPTTPYKQYAASPPSHLAISVHSLLLSTLLQPSAVFLALWYIARLPVSFLPIALGPEQMKEIRFRSVLLGEGQAEFEATDSHVPFRLVVIGCMLANKWLDDHTFSNKTWHTISNVPIRLLNRLESLALDIFTYDLSVSSADWSQWLVHLKAHHTYLSSPKFPQPISRPSASPQSIVRKAIDEIIQTQDACDFPPSRPQPVFLGVEERRKEKIEWERATQVVDNALSDIDLDENGPLRDEYLPRKRHSVNGPANKHPGATSRQTVQDENAAAQKFSQMDLEKTLPPPAKWSPAGDEPILRDRNSVNGPYVAVQPPVPSVPPVQFQVLASYQRHQEFYSIGGWPLPQPNMSMGYLFDVHVPAPVMQAMPTAGAMYTQCEVMLPVPHPGHARSQSLYLYDQTQEMHQHRLRSYSQSLSYVPHEVTTGQAQLPWTGRNQYGLTYAQGFPPLPTYCGMGLASGYQSTWLSAA